MILTIILICLCGGLLFAILMSVPNYMHTVRFQKYAEAGMPCCVYQDDELCYGYIYSRIGNQVIVEYKDELDNQYRKTFHVFDIYPTW